MHKIVINVCYGAYSMSKEGQDWLKEKYDVDNYEDLSRHDPRLVECVETLKEKVNGYTSRLTIMEVKSNKYRICEYDGREWVETPDDLDWIELKDNEG